MQAKQARRLLGMIIILGSACTPIPPSFAHDKRDPLQINAPSRPKLKGTLNPYLFKCNNLDDCQNQAAEFCAGFNYPNGKIRFRDLPSAPRPLPIYGVVCFD